MNHNFLDFKEEIENLDFTFLDFTDLSINIHMITISNILETKEKIHLLKMLIDKMRKHLSSTIDNNDIFIIINACSSILYTLQEKLILEMKLENVKNFVDINSEKC